MDPLGFEKTTMARSWDSCEWKEVTTGEIDKQNSYEAGGMKHMNFLWWGMDVFWRNTLRKTNMSHENQWLEDKFPIEIFPF